ncbi:hypothetical protein ELH80_01115 [Rhizobium ruizarguesonis]|uniref:hypothetical protein n=1 Tax=Rhizobium ruizarguesonis TaxID=2081791 RepID=UPI0010304F99|nr:hypothetical protein [Rhizobium ruizarguesonis]TAT76908.1 hypothetical protein ELI56_01125 [Rhizobium ruizarguesonis]TAZ33158.1 hypothetical protein ELH80_01115 [Rhizobium ruizarguesonis]TBC07816.1 hypothetical protein ELH37_01135 [Rhizobium ruizarguesonis]
MATDGHNLREQLLAETLDYALERVPYYKRFPHLFPKALSLQLADFPLIDKDIVSTNLFDFLVLDRFPDYIISSGGTTVGAPNISFRNEEEYRAVHYYFTGGEPSASTEFDTAGFGIDIFFNTNGHYWRKPSGWPLISVTLEQPAHADTIEKLIREGLIVGEKLLQARHIQAQNGPLRTLTGYYVSKGFLPHGFAITSLIAYGAHIPKVWRRRLREVWGAEVKTFYGLSEFAPGNALECPHCGGYHYWTCWPEFLAINDDTAVSDGDARLVLTSLLPFTRVQPRIRYLTGDFVTVTGYCGEAKQLGFVFRGREISSAVGRTESHSEVILSEIDLLEALEQLPDIAVRPHASEYQLWADPTIRRPPFRMGAPRFRLHTTSLQGTSRIEIEIETTFDPAEDLARADKMREDLIALLQLERPDLPTKLDKYGMALSIHLSPPGSLNLRFKSTL